MTRYATSITATMREKVLISEAVRELMCPPVPVPALLLGRDLCLRGCVGLATPEHLEVFRGPRFRGFAAGSASQPMLVPQLGSCWSPTPLDSEVAGGPGFRAAAGAAPEGRNSPGKEGLSIFVRTRELPSSRNQRRRRGTSAVLGAEPAASELRNPAWK